MAVTVASGLAVNELIGDIDTVLLVLSLIDDESECHTLLEARTVDVLVASGLAVNELICDSDTVILAL